MVTIVLHIAKMPGKGGGGTLLTDWQGDQLLCGQIREKLGLPTKVSFRSSSYQMGLMYSDFSEEVQSILHSK